MIIKKGIIMKNLSTRYYSTNPQCSLNLLLSYIDHVYHTLSNSFDELTVSNMRDIQNKIRSGKYNLSAFQLLFQKKEESLIDFSHHHDISSFKIITLDDDSHAGIFPILQEDKLVLMALGLMLNKRMNNLNLLNSLSFGLKSSPAVYYEHIRSIEGPISSVYKLDMRLSIERVNKESLLTQLEAVVDNDEIMKLLKSFLYIPIIHEGEDYSYLMEDSIPVASLITDALLNFSLIGLDNHFHLLFPSFSYTYARYLNEIIVTISDEDEEYNFESTLFLLFDSLHIDGNIISIIKPGGNMPCYHGGVIHLTKDGVITITESDFS